MPITRRVLLGSVTLLAACSAPARSPSAPPATRELATNHGPIQVPVAPQRVVCLHQLCAYSILDVGVTPIGVPDLSPGLLPPVYDTTWPTNAFTLGPVTEPDIEKVAALRPDLILGISAPAFEPDYERLRQIAPTVVYTAQSSAANWDELAEQFANAVNRQDALRGLKQRYAERTAGIRATYAAQLTASRWYLIAGQANSQWYVLHDTSSSGKICAAAGITFGPTAMGRPGAWTAFSLEQLNLLADGDVIGVNATRDGKPDGPTQVIVDSAPFQGLKATRTGRVLPMTGFFPGSYQAVLALVDRLEAAIQAL